MQPLSTYLQGRDNNINLIRFIAASMVLLAHSFVVVAAQRDAGPFVQSTGHDLGYHAVNIFFAASGFLIAQSWKRHPSLSHYAAGRILRIWPALFFCALFVTYVIGPALTHWTMAAYFHASETYKYLPDVMSLVNVDSPLPGVFTTLPGNTEIDAPLWTLKYEMICYVALALFGWFGGFASARRFSIWAVPVFILLLVTSTWPVAHDVSRPYMHCIRFGFCFGLGVVAFEFADRLPLSMLIVAALGLVAVLTRHSVLYTAALWTFTAYTTIWLAFVPQGFLRGFNRLGDYSYGIYIYAYPLQLLIVSQVPHIAPMALFVSAMSLTFGLAILSWHYLERPSLASKARLTEWFARQGRAIRRYRLLPKSP